MSRTTRTVFSPNLLNDAVCKFYRRVVVQRSFYAKRGASVGARFFDQLVEFHLSSHPFKLIQSNQHRFFRAAFALLRDDVPFAARNFTDEF